MTMAGESLQETAAALSSGEVGPIELVTAAIEMADRWEPHIESLLARLDDKAMARARMLERELHQSGARTPLHGVPIVVKDLIDVDGAPTTAGSKILSSNVASVDADVVVALHSAGAIVLAKSNTHEFGNGALTPPTKNPWDVARMPGGSSGGTAAAVAAGVVCAGLGTDSAGSIREPAALCGVVGLKPSLGSVSSRGIYQLTETMSAVGPMTRSVADCAIMLDAMLDRPERSDMWWHREIDLAELAGLRVGVLGELADPIDPEIGARLDGLAGALEGAGAQVAEVAAVDIEAVNAAAFLTLGAESLSLHLTWLAERADDYSPQVRSFLQMGYHFTASDYVDAQRLRRKYTNRVDDALRTADVLLAPAQIVTAPAFTDTMVTFMDGRTLPRDFSLIRPLLPFSFTGHPAISVPGWSVRGLPVAFQLVGRYGSDDRLVQVARTVQALTPWGTGHRLPELPNR